MSIQAKFICRSITDYGNDQKQVRLDAAVAGPGNESWSKYTPSGSIDMMITNPAASAQIEVGKEYLITFEPAG